MVRTPLPPLVVASAAVLLITSVTPSGRVALPTTAAVTGTVPASRATPAPTVVATSLVGSGPATSAAAHRARWRWPVLPRPPVARAFRAPLTTYGAGHRGLDLAVADGTPVLAVEPGVVTHAGLVAGRGTVTVVHPGGLSSTYEPVDALVTVGAVVVTGQVIGALRVRAGPAHCGARACLHLGARQGAAYLDPYPLLAGGRPALLPLGE